jgi:iron complex transport system substrate-binding protein
LFEEEMNFLKYILIIAIPVVSYCGNGYKKDLSIPAEKGNVVERAERFILLNKGGFSEVMIIDPWQGARGVKQIYNLVKRGSALPAGMDSSDVIFVPVHKIICMSTTYVAMITALGEEKTISGLSGTNYVYSPEIIRNVEKGLVADVGYEANLNKELILKISPDLIMIYGIGGESSGYLGKIKELGIKVIINADYLETDPLSRAEWIKLFGALYCKENMADSIYKNEVEEYNRLKSFILFNSSTRPKVLLGLPFKDTWYISPGNSYISKLISDSGGDYLWSDTKSSVSMPYGLENVYIRGLKADYWLNTGSANSRNEISDIDPRLDDLPCYIKSNVFNNTKRITSAGGNDYWESGTLFPHLLLKDIAAILHPELFTDQELMFYKKLD